MRSFFGTQEGAFSLSIESISAVRSKSKEIVDEKWSVETRDHNPIVYNRPSPLRLDTKFLLCVGICVAGAMVYFLSKKEVKGLYLELW
jgi:hypothetical protein